MHGHGLEPSPAEPLTGAAGVGKGWQQTIVGVNPALATDFVRKVPGETIERVRCVTFKFSLSATVNSRLGEVRAESPDGIIIAQALSSNVLTAGQTAWQSYWPGAGLITFPTQNRQIAPLWDLFMEPGSVLRITSENLSAGDSFTEIMLTIERYPTNDPWNPCSHPIHHDRRRQHRHGEQRPDVQLG